MLGLDVRSSDLMTPVISVPRVTPRVTVQFWTSFTDSQTTFIEERSVQGRDRRLSFSSLRHRDECEATRFACIAVLHYCDGLNRAVSCEENSQLLF